MTNPVKEILLAIRTAEKDADKNRVDIEGLNRLIVQGGIAGRRTDLLE
jgi:hypothetical protein